MARKYGILFLRRMLIAAIGGQLADLGGVLLREAPRLVEIVAPLLRRHAGGLEDVEGAGDGRGQRRLIPQLEREVGQERPQPLPLITAAGGAAAPWPTGGFRRWAIRSFRLA